MKKNRFGRVAVALAAILFFSACPAQKEPELSAEEVQQQIDGVLAQEQETIDKHWPILVARRQECEASCKSKKCACLDELTKDEQIEIMLMVSYTAHWNIFKTEDREFTLYYNWLPGDSRCHNDLKELLLAFPQSYYVENGSLGLYLISHGLEDNISFDIAVVLQQLYAEKKIADIQAYLKSIHLLFAGVKEIDFGLEQKMDLPYFILTQQSKEKEDTENIIFQAAVYDPVAFKDFKNQKYPWYGDSLSALILVTK